jgi:hypothetical protein
MIVCAVADDDLAAGESIQVLPTPLPATRIGSLPFPPRDEEESLP